MLNRSLLVLLAPLALSCTKANASPKDPLVVHEWGTFTSFEGADGASVEGLQHETESLPSFVHSRVSAKTTPLAVYGDASKDVPVHHCTGKMETPVIYFHTQTARHVRVDVRYAGLLTQWYPAAASVNPAYSGTEQHDLQAVPVSSLGWDVDLVPRNVRPPSLPSVPAESDWQKAREVDAAYVRTTGLRSEADQYIFYRGLMRTVPQPRVTPAADDSAVTIDNGSGEPLHAAFLLDMNETEGRFVSLGVVPTGPRAVAHAGAYRPKAAVVEELGRAMSAALEAEGLFADEARAMVRTWSETWFAQSGTRVLYLVPRSVTDRTLPLTITPAPDRIVRVLVGRVEYLSHAKHAEITRDVLAGGTVDPVIVKPEDRGAALTRLARLGRFAEPATRAVAASSTDPKMPAAASRVLGVVTRF